MRKEVEPLAANLNWVLRPSSRVATKRKVANGHHPGNGSRVDQTAAPESAAAIATVKTNRLRRVSRDIEVKAWDPDLIREPYAQVVPSLLDNRFAIKRSQ